MKRKVLTIGAVLLLTASIANAQTRAIARGADKGELYMAAHWYAQFDFVLGSISIMRTTLLNVTEHGKNADIVWYDDYPVVNDGGEIISYFDPAKLPVSVMSDVKQGMVYTLISSTPPFFMISNLWASYDYGKTWTFRETETPDNNSGYFPSGSIAGSIYKGIVKYPNTGVYESADFGETWKKITNKGYIKSSECGFNPCEMFGVNIDSSDTWSVYYTADCYENYTKTAIDPEFVYGYMNGIEPAIYRGAVTDEIYVTSWFPDTTYKVSLSQDKGQTFRTVYRSDLRKDGTIIYFMPDREPGVFYIVKSEGVETSEPGLHGKYTISYYRDYGETLVDVYCHDLMPNYLEVGAGVMDLTAKINNTNNVSLHWNAPQVNIQPTGYQIYRNNALLAQIENNTDYLDNTLPLGDYSYDVRAIYSDGSQSLSYNIVTITVNQTQRTEESIDNENIIIYPNPTIGEVQINDNGLKINTITIFDLPGRTVYHTTRATFNIGHLEAGIYFVQIATEKGVITKKLIKK
jgi:hypothetical protein